MPQVVNVAEINKNSNVAGIAGNPFLIENVEVDMFEKVLKINVVGMLLCLKYEIRQMVQHEPITLWVQINLSLHGKAQADTIR